MLDLQGLHRFLASSPKRNDQDNGHTRTAMAATTKGRGAGRPERLPLSLAHARARETRVPTPLACHQVMGPGWGAGRRRTTRPGTGEGQNRASARRRPLSQRGGSSINDVPEYLAPGVYVEEVSYRSKSIEGVSTSTNGFARAIRSGVEVVAEWVGILLVGFLLGAAGSTAVGWAWHRRWQCRGPCRRSSTRPTAAR